MLNQITQKSNLFYPLALITTQNVKKNFTIIAQKHRVSRDTISRSVPSKTESRQELITCAQKYFQHKKTITFIFDDTYIQKPYSEYIEGTGEHFDTKKSRRVRSLKLLVGALSDGKVVLPFDCKILFDPMFGYKQEPGKNDLIKDAINECQRLFPDKKILIVADGAFASIDLLKWTSKNNIKFDVRMHSNRVVIYKNRSLKINSIADLQTTGNKQSRTVKVKWHDISLYVTAHKRTDKNGKDTIIYLASTYKSVPSQHVKQYKKRWNIEKMFRTCKQSLGLASCMSKKYEKQLDHIFSTLVAYLITQLHRKKRRMKNAEEAIRDLQFKNSRV
jgi:hypothetical protein